MRAGKSKCKGQRAKKEAVGRGGSPRHDEKHLHQGYQGKEDPPSPSSLQTVESSLSDSPEKQENKGFLSFVVPSCHITSFTSTRVTAQKDRMLCSSVAHTRAEAG